MEIDRLDSALVELLASEPRISVLEASRRLGVARGTVQARIDRMLREGVIVGFGPDVRPAAIGYTVTAFVTAQIEQGERDDETVAALGGIPEVLEVHTITGDGDLLIRIVARSNSDLQRVIDAVVASKSIARTSTVIALAEAITPRTMPLLRAAAERSRTRQST